MLFADYNSLRAYVQRHPAVTGANIHDVNGRLGRILNTELNVLYWKETDRFEHSRLIRALQSELGGLSIVIGEPLTLESAKDNK